MARYPQNTALILLLALFAPFVISGVLLTWMAHPFWFAFLVIGYGCYFAMVAWQRRHEVQFSLRSLLLVMTTVAIIVGLVSSVIF